MAQGIAAAYGATAHVHYSRNCPITANLEARPRIMIFIGNGDTAACHHPAYDFCDAANPHGVWYWVRLVEIGMSA